MWQIKIRHIPRPHSHIKRYFQHFNSKTSHKKDPSCILRMPNNHFIHISILTYKDMTCLCCVVFIYKRTERNSLLRKSGGLSAPLQKKKEPARCSWLRTLEKILKMTERAWYFGSSAAIMILSNMLQRAIAVKCCKTSFLLNKGHARTPLNTLSCTAKSAPSELFSYTSFHHEFWVLHIPTEMPWW